MNEVERRLAAHPCVLDGATGTELERRGIPTTLPLWSARALWEAPDTIQAIHADYARAGVDFLTANTFRTQRRTLARGGRGEDAAALTRLAVELAHAGGQAAARAPCVLGSAPTLEDCYRPEDVPDPEALEREHAAHARHLADAGVDAILVETMNCVREARAAARAAKATGLPFLVGFVCWDGATLLSGEPLGEAIAEVAPLGPCAVAVNCLPPTNVAPCLPALVESRLHFGVYANLGVPDEVSGFARSDACSATEFAEHAAAWIEAGASFVGGCCGTQPAHLRAVVERVGLARHDA